MAVLSSQGYAPVIDGRSTTNRKVSDVDSASARKLATACLALLCRQPVLVPRAACLPFVALAPCPSLASSLAPRPRLRVVADAPRTALPKR